MPQMRWFLVTFLGSLVVGCGDSAPTSTSAASPRQPSSPSAVPEERPAGIPESANFELQQTLLESRNATYHPSDGGGSVRLLEASPVHAGERGHWTVEYRAGPLGVAIGGRLYFQVSAFWGWSSPQTQHPGHPGFTRVESTGEATLTIEEGPQTLIAQVTGAKLAENDTVTFYYGEGDTAVADRFADDCETLYVWVDGDGAAPETRRLVPSDLRIEVTARPAADFLVLAPSAIAVGETFELSIAFVDGISNRATDFVGEVQLTPIEHVQMPATVTFESAHRGARKVPVTVTEKGIYTFEATHKQAVRQSNPLLVSSRPRRVLWADLQGHSSFSDGTGSPEAYHEYARDVAALDVIALTDHDHHGLPALDEDPGRWQHIQDVTREYHDPGRFVTLLGFEWTSWIWGHRHVLYFGDRGPLLSNLDPATSTPGGLWKALEGLDAITIAHHPAGGAQATDWDIVPDPSFEPAVEIVSVHGSSEAMESPRPIYRPQKGHFVRDALQKGYRLGFLGSTDGHDGHPGLAHRAAPSGGLTALLTGERSRAAVAAAIRRRATYATSGVRIYVEFSLGRSGMGSVVPTPTPESSASYVAYVLGTAPLQYLELIKNGELYYQLDCGSEREAGFAFTDPEPRAGDTVYLRATQTDGHAAWSSPIWTEAEAGN